LAQAIATVQLPDIKVAGDDTSGEVTPPGVTTIGKLPLKLRGNAAVGERHRP
jgi:outer membrane receptor for ferric coprogen and ferric-rhodotorulic acid